MILKSIITIIFCFIYLNICYGENVEKFNSFSFDLLQKIIEKKGDVNIAFSPVPIWGLLGLVEEATLYNSSIKPLTNLLGVSKYERNFLKDYNKFLSLSQSTNEVDWKTNYTVYLNESNDQHLKDAFNEIANNLTNIIVQQLNQAPLKQINKKNGKSQQEKIRDFISVDDLTDAELVLTNILNFKSKWQFEFLGQMKTNENFRNKNHRKTNVEYLIYNNTMIGPLVNELYEIIGYFVEFRFETEKKISLLLMQTYNYNAMEVLEVMKKKNLKEILNEIKHPLTDFHIAVPKFNIINTLEMNEILSDMGIANIFHKENSNLQLVDGKNYYISSITQKAEIEVNSETVTTEAESIEYESSYYFFKSFLYFIVDKEKNAILFAGQVTNPSN